MVWRTSKDLDIAIILYSSFLWSTYSKFKDKPTTDEFKLFGFLDYVVNNFTFAYNVDQCFPNSAS
jgi:hypothetical protein